MTNQNKTRVYCGVCSCDVVADGHDTRCRVPAAGGWDDRRRLSWIGNTVHRMDVQLAVQRLVLQPAEWENTVQEWCTHSALAAYYRQYTDVGTHSDKYVATSFQASYSGEFRMQYLRQNFPTVWEEIAMLWQIPANG